VSRVYALRTVLVFSRLLPRFSEVQRRADREGSGASGIVVDKSLSIRCVRVPIADEMRSLARSGNLSSFCAGPRDRVGSLSNQDMGDIGGGWQGAGCHLGSAPAEHTC
jgi:hypothetical protein